LVPVRPGWERRKARRVVSGSIWDASRTTFVPLSQKVSCEVATVSNAAVAEVGAAMVGSR